MGAEVAIGWDNSELNRGAAQAEKRVRGFESAVTGMGRVGGMAIGGIAKGFALIGGTTALVKVGTDAAEASMAFEALEKSLKVVMGSAEAAQGELEELTKVAALPGGNLRAAIGLSRSLQAAGFEADFARKMILETQNAVTVMGGSSYDVENVVDAFKDLVVEGTLVDDKVDRIAERLPMLRKLMEEAFGSASTTKVREMGVTADEFARVMVEALEKKVPRAAESSQTALGRLKNQADVTLKSIGDIFNDSGLIRDTFEAFTDGLKTLGEVADSFKEFEFEMPMDESTRQFKEATAAYKESVAEMEAVYAAILRNGNVEGELPSQRGKLRNFPAVIGESEDLPLPPSMTREAAAEWAKEAAEAEKEAADAAEQRRTAIQQQANATRQIVEGLRVEIEAARLRASGQEDVATALEREVALRAEAQRIAAQTNLTEQAALDLLRQREAAMQAGKGTGRNPDRDGDGRLTRQSFGGLSSWDALQQRKGNAGTAFPGLDGWAALQQRKGNAGLLEAKAPVAEAVKRGMGAGKGTPQDKAVQILDKLLQAGEATAKGVGDLVNG